MSAELQQLENRLTHVETALSQVQERLGILTPSSNWVDRIAGSLSDIPEEDYQLFLECCRKVREEGDFPDEGHV
jgi:hypothetical protein